MAITLTGTGGLFTRLGKIFALQRHLGKGVCGETLAVGDGTGSGTADAGATWGTGGATVYDLKTIFDAINAQFASTDQDLISDLYPIKASIRSSISSSLSSLTSLTRSVLSDMVNDDADLVDTSVLGSLRELIRQMGVATTTYVTGPAVGASVAAQTVPANTGDPTVIASVVNKYGVNKQYVLPEVIELTVTNDSQGGNGATAGSEPASILGEVSISDPFTWNWPNGSSASTSLPNGIIDPTLDASGNLMYNSSFDDFTTANVPDHWAILGGAAGTDIFSEASIIYRSGGKALKFTGVASPPSPLPAVWQKFNVTTPAVATNGTSTVLKPNTVYAVRCVARDSGAGLVAGVIKVQLTDQAGTPAVVNDDAGTANEFSIAFGSTTASYAAFSGFFRTPKVLPSTGLALAVRVTTALTNTESMYIDDLAMCEAVEAYTGGPYIAAFRGATDCIIGDKWNIAVTNDRAGILQDGFDRNFPELVANGLQLPITGTTLVADSLAG